MSLEHNNFRAAFAPPASALHGTSFIKTANQKTSFRSIFNALSTRLGSCLCLNPEFRSGAGWGFTFVLSAIITVLLCILLLPIKLILLGLSCCPCASRPPVRGEEIQVIPQLPPQPPQRPLSSRQSSDSGISGGLDSGRFSPSSFIPIHPEPLTPPPSTQSLGVVPEEVCLREYLGEHYPQRNLSNINLTDLGISILQPEDFPEGTNILDLPASLFFPEGAPPPLFLNQQDITAATPTSPQPSIASQTTIAPQAADQTAPQQDDTISLPESLATIPPVETAHIIREVDQTLTAQEFLNSAYPNMDHSALIHGALINVQLQGIPLENSEDILGLPALIAFPDLVAGQPVRPTFLDLDNMPRSLSADQEIAPPPPTAADPISPNDPRYIFLQNHFPELSPEYYSQHINLLASLAGVDSDNFDLLQLPLEVFVEAPAPQPDYSPISPEEAQQRYNDVSAEEHARRSNDFIRYLIENSPQRWTFLNRLKNNISASTSSLTLRREWFKMLDVISNKTSPEITDREVQDVARACLFKINSILKDPTVAPERKEELLKYVASYYDSSPDVWVEAIQQEVFLQNTLNPQIISMEEAGAAAAAASVPINQILPPFNTQATDQEVQGYTQLLRTTLSRPVLTNMDNIHLAPTNDEYLESLTRGVPSSWVDIHEPLQTRIEQIAQNQNTRNNWRAILNCLASGTVGSISSREAQALSRSTMYQLLKLLNNPNIPNERKLLIINHVAFYRDRCPPTWVRVAGQELQTIFNSNDTSTNIVFSWVQAFKEGLVSEIFRNEGEWHMMTAFKHNHGGELGLDNTGIILDQFTLAIAGRRYTQQHDNYLSLFRNAYQNSGSGLVDSALQQVLTGSEDQIRAIRNGILADLEAAGIPEIHRAGIVMEVFFPEENDYKPSREAIVYLLLKEGVITTQNNN